MVMVRLPASNPPCAEASAIKRRGNQGAVLHYFGRTSSFFYFANDCGTGEPMVNTKVVPARGRRRFY
jgi:hypothetical protein